MNSKEYWNKKIIIWEKSSYQGNSKDLSFVEKIATKFRKPIRKRKEILLGILKDRVKGKTIVELGCGSGGLCFDLLELGATKVIGIDIANEAINIANIKAEELGVNNVCEFYVSDAGKDMDIPSADIVIGLGFIDYLCLPDLRKLLTQLKCEFIFSFPEKKTNFINILHYFYLKSQGCPIFNKFRRNDFIDIPSLIFFTKNDMVFMSNFKP